MESNFNWVDGISEGLNGSLAPVHNFTFGVCTLGPQLLGLPLQPGPVSSHSFRRPLHAEAFEQRAGPF